MVKLAVGLLVAVVGFGVPPVSADTPAGGISRTSEPASQAGLYRFCASAGDSIALSVASATENAVMPIRASVSLLDDEGAPLASLTNSWRAPYTGLYVVRVTADAGTTPGDYVVSIAINGVAAAADPVDLSVTQSQDPDPVSAGGLLTYTITVANAGPGVAAYANLLDPIPVGTTFVSGGWSGPQENWECTLPPVGQHGKVSCTNKCFEAGGSVVFTITVRVNACLGDVQLTNIVTASTPGADAQPWDNVAAATSLVVDERTCDDGSVCTGGDHCAAAAALSENFDLVAPRDWPPGWTASLLVGPAGATGWRTGTTIFDTGPNSVFAPDAPDIRDAVMDSPPVRITSPTAQVIFRNRYDLELQADGGVFEIKIGNGPFLDIEAAGGSFVAGGYTARISDDFQSPIGGRNAWTGQSLAFVQTIVDLPPAVLGQDVVFRWRLATDRALGNVGQWIDSIVVTGPDSCLSGAPLTCDDGDPCTADACDALAGCRNLPFSCDDGNPCTNDACNSVTQCTHVNNSLACDDHDVCTLIDSCASGACVGTGPVTCSSGDPCASSACDPSEGCYTTSANFDTTGFSAGRVDGRDVAVIARSWNSCPGDPRFDAVANLDRAGICVDLDDFHLFMTAFGRTCAP